MIEFDTGNKKPDIFNILKITIAVFVIVGILLLTKVSSIYVNIVFIIYFIAVVVILIRTLLKQLAYNPYSYNTIYYIGFAIFVAYIIIALVLVTIQELMDPQPAQGLSAIHILLGSAKTYMLLTSPLVLLFSLALCSSNVALMKREGRRIYNLLGVILSLLMIGGIVFFYVYDFSASGSVWEVMRHDLFINTFAALYLYYECMLTGSIIAGIIVNRYEVKPVRDFIIVLGCGLRKDGTPTPLLQGRLDKALEFYRKQKEETGIEATFVTSGGQGPDEVIAESTSMKNYLLSKGIAEDKVIEEDKSTNTLENMRFSKEKIYEISKDPKILFSTTNYHVFRSGLDAHRVKMRAVGIGATTKWYFWPNAAVREFVGILTEHRLKQALIIGGLILVYAVLTWYVYIGAYL